ncbi:hypothetical protein BKA70DRAFT_1326799 [Coprinopsis sp. MPI-PUGE-AT-0042]|nr:hypothetical protein BKA70DRAFT_1326799 [Coprinopsis sp. MPI-PUGE-AT-0042]
MDLLEILENTRISKVPGSAALMVRSLLRDAQDSDLTLFIRLVWLSQTSPVKALFLITRYILHIHFAFSFVFNMAPTLSAELCRTMFIMTSLTGVLTGLFSEGDNPFLLPGVRIFQRNKILGTYLMVQYFIAWSAVLCIQTFDASLQMDLPSLTCALKETSANLMGITFAISVGSVSILILITLSIMLVKYGNLKNALTRAFVRDGTVFLYGIAMIGVISTVLTFTGQDSIKWVLGAPKSVVHSLLACRMRLRKEGRIIPFTSIQFAQVKQRKPKWWHPVPVVEGIAMTVVTETYESEGSKVMASETEAQKVRSDIQDRVFDITRL